MADTEYLKLPGRGLRSQGLVSVSRNLCSLYLGTDHLLQIESVGGYREEYKRFYFRDIQAITIHKTQTAAMTLAGTGVFALIFTLIGRGIQESVVAAIFYVIAAVLGLIFVIQGLIFAFRGGSCVCQLKTAVQTEQLPSLKRIRTTEKALAKIQPFIEQAQGSLSPDELKFQVDALLQNPPPPVIGRHQRAPAMNRAGETTATKPYSGKVHGALFLLLLIAGMASLTHIFFHPTWFVALESLCGIALLGVLIIALVKQHGSDLSSAVRKVTWITLGLMCASLLFGYVLAMFIIVSAPGVANDQWEIIKLYSEYEPLETMWLLISLIISAFTSVILGLLGMFYLKRWRAQKNVAPAPPEVRLDQPTS